MNYERIYNQLITKARNRVCPDGYHEEHHIIPRSLNGPDSPDNIVKLTVKEHRFAHILLFKIFKLDFPNLIYAIYSFYNDDNKHRIELRKSRKFSSWLRRSKALRDAHLRRELGKKRLAMWNSNSNTLRESIKIYGEDDED